MSKDKGQHITVKAETTEQAVDDLVVFIEDGKKRDTITVESIEEFKARGRVDDCDCGLISCVCVEARRHKKDRLRPVILKDGKLWYIKQVNPFDIAFTWSPQPTKKAKEFHVMKTIRTLHRYAAPAFFKPSIFEVFAQLPEWEHELDYISAFRTEPSDKSVDSWTDIEMEAYQAGFHVAYTTLYAVLKGSYLQKRPT